MRLTLHKEYGVNPSMSKCFICGEVASIALLGANRGKKAPHEIQLGEVCNTCKNAIKNGVVFLIEVKNGEQEKNPSSPYRTGFILGVKKEAVAELVGDADCCFMEENVMQQILGDENYKNYKERHNAS